MGNLAIVRERLRQGDLEFGAREILRAQNGDDDQRNPAEVLAAKSGVPLVTFNEMRFEHWEKRAGHGLEDALELALKMSRGDDSFSMFTLAGPTGVGKTHLAIAIAWDWLLAGASVVYRQVPTMLDELRATFDYAAHDYQEVSRFDTLFGWFKRCHLLVLDDLGMEVSTNWAQEKLDSIVDNRWLNRLPTVVTTNLKREDLPARIADRLQDWRCSRVVQLSAASYRVERAKSQSE